MRSVLYNIIRCSNGLLDARDASYGTASPILSLSLSLSLEILGLRAFWVSSIYS